MKRFTFQIDADEIGDPYEHARAILIRLPDGGCVWEKMFSLGISEVLNTIRSISNHFMENLTIFAASVKASYSKDIMPLQL